MELAFHLTGHGVRRVADQETQLGRPRVQFQFVTVHTREIQQIVDEAGQMRYLTLDRLSGALGGGRRPLQDLDGEANGRERIPQLVRQRRQEIRLPLILGAEDSFTLRKRLFTCGPCIQGLHEVRAGPPNDGRQHDDQDQRHRRDRERRIDDSVSETARKRPANDKWQQKGGRQQAAREHPDLIRPTDQGHQTTVRAAGLQGKTERQDGDGVHQRDSCVSGHGVELAKAVRVAHQRQRGNDAGHKRQRVRSRARDDRDGPMSPRSATPSSTFAMEAGGPILFGLTVANAPAGSVASNWSMPRSMPVRCSNNVNPPRTPERWPVQRRTSNSASARGQ